MKILLKVSPKCQPFCSGLNVLTIHVEFSAVLWRHVLDVMSHHAGCTIWSPWDAVRLTHPIMIWPLTQIHNETRFAVKMADALQTTFAIAFSVKTKCEFWFLFEVYFWGGKLTIRLYWFSLKAWYRTKAKTTHELRTVALVVTKPSPEPMLDFLSRKFIGKYPCLDTTMSVRVSKR